MFLNAHFGEVELHMPDESGEGDGSGSGSGGGGDNEPSLLVRLDEADAQINLVSLVNSPCITFLVRKHR